jgi:hypothetical protein
MTNNAMGAKQKYSIYKGSVRDVRTLASNEVTQAKKRHSSLNLVMFVNCYC